MQEKLPRTYYLIARKNDRYLREDKLARMQFLAGVPGPDTDPVFARDITDGMPLIFTDLPQLAEHFLSEGWDAKGASPSKVQLAERSVMLVEGLTLIGYTPSESTMFTVHTESITDAISRAIDRLREKGPAVKPADEDALQKQAPLDYIWAFTRDLKKCFGEYREGSLYFASLAGGESWNIGRSDDVFSFRFGTLPLHDFIMRERIPRFFRTQTVCMVRVFTDQQHEGLPFKELYGFILMPDGGMINIRYRDLAAAHNKDATTGKPLTSEKNVIYCDLQNNKLPSFEID